MRALAFFRPMEPPTATAQERQAKAVWNKRRQRHEVRFYYPAHVLKARDELECALAPNAPEEPFSGPLRLTVRWYFRAKDGSRWNDGDYRTSAPDLDNMLKMFQDVMTATGYWHDDAQVAELAAGKYWIKGDGAMAGVYVAVEELPPSAYLEGGAE